MGLDFKINENLCTKCGACAKDCPAHIIKVEEGKIPSISAEDEANCIECQHCLAVCPSAALSILGFNPAISLELKAVNMPNFAQATRLLRGRRSVRQYRKENVKPETVSEMLATIANSPTGCNYRNLKFTLIDNLDELKKFHTAIVEAIEKAHNEKRIPEALSFVYDAVADWKQKGHDQIFRGAPHILVVSAEKEAPTGQEDVIIALSYFELLACAAGLGAVWCGYLKFIFDVCPELKDIIGIPRDQYCYAMLFGYPLVHYARTVQRDKSASINRIKF